MRNAPPAGIRSCWRGRIPYKELRQYGIEEGGVLTEQSYQEIMRELLPVRAKKKALHLLERMDRTEQQLYRKLADGGYPDQVAKEAVD